MPMHVSKENLPYQRGNQINQSRNCIGLSVVLGLLLSLPCLALPCLALLCLSPYCNSRRPRFLATWLQQCHAVGMLPTCAYCFSDVKSHAMLCVILYSLVFVQRSVAVVGMSVIVIVIESRIFYPVFAPRGIFVSETQTRYPRKECR